MMRHLRSATFFHLCVVSCASAICFPELQAEDTATSAPPIIDLFDGRTLDGWEGDSAHWRIEDGTILGEIAKGQSLNKNTWLVWRGGELSDFELNVQFKLTGLPAANSGIQIRCQVHNVDHVAGFQADLDMGATWLGRIYDEHGRALLVERGSRVQILPNGERHVETFAPANQYAVLFRDNDWNDYRIVAVGDHFRIYINGTLFSELLDQQIGEQDLNGALAFQLHSGPETRIQFRNIRLEHLKPGDPRMPTFAIKHQMKPRNKPDEKNAGIVPTGKDGKPLNLGFEAGDLSNWTATGTAFNKQPVNRDGIAQRWQGQVSNKDGDYFIGGYEILQDAGSGTLISATFKVTNPYGSFLFGGGEAPTTRTDVVLLNDDGSENSVIFKAVGTNQEQMRRVAVDLRKFEGKFIPDRDGDDKPDSEPVALLDGFGFADTHETLNSFMWGPDGWLYGNQGVFNSSQIGRPGAVKEDRKYLAAGVWRYHPTRHIFEVFAHGGSNQWGLDYDEHGQIFMTYCRSFWGRGDVTHVMQGGHYWNQVNSGYAPFISTQSLPGRPWMTNYQLASQRSGHGEGGSGKPGSNDVYGGHSHVGTMIYLGDNWPSEYRNHLFTRNLHGHQMNHVINRREAGGYNSVHAGYDTFFCADQQYVRAWAVQLLCDFARNSVGRDSSPVQRKANVRTGLETRPAFITLAESDESLFVRRYLGSAMQRVPAETAWQIAEALCGRDDSITDRDLPLLIWYGIAPLAADDLDRAFKFAMRQNPSARHSAIHDSSKECGNVSQIPARISRRSGKPFGSWRAIRLQRISRICWRYSIRRNLRGW